MNNGSKWSKYKNKATGDIVEARPNTKFPEYQLLRLDEGNFGGVKTCTSMFVTEFELGNWIMDNNGNKVSNVTIPCLIVGLCKMLVVSVVMIIICLLMAKVGE